MIKNNPKKKFNRRIFLIIAFKGIFIFLILARLFYLQVRENFRFSQLSEKNRSHLLPIVPKRGIIYDRLGTPLAEDVLLWEVLFFKSRIQSEINLFINTIASIIHLNIKDKEKIRELYEKQPALYPILIKQDITRSEIAALETFSYKIPGVFIRPFFRRHYHYDDALTHIIGYTGTTNDSQIALKAPNWQVGRYALESLMDSFLRGEVGYIKYEVNARGHVIRQLEQQSSISGNNISLTIDAKLQNEIHKILSRYNSASAVVTNINNGDILAMCSYPSFNPNLFVQTVPSDIWNKLTNDNKSPLLNKPIMGLYPPASILKLLISMEALEKNIIDEESEITCNGHISVGRERFHCWKRNGHGKVNLHKALKESCDIFFYNLAEKMSLENMSDIGFKFGLSQTHLNLMKGESSGRLPIKDYIDKYYSLGDQIVSIIGQGKWLVTPLQLAQVASIFATKGTYRNLNIIKSIEYPNKVVFTNTTNEIKTINYDINHFDVVSHAMLAAINEKGGTAILARTQDPNWALAGKTGTAQVLRITQAQRQQGLTPNHLKPWAHRDHGLFTGFVPYDNPMYSISVVVEHGGGSALTSAPIAGEIAKLLKKRHQINIEADHKLENIIKKVQGQ